MVQDDISIQPNRAEIARDWMLVFLACALLHGLTACRGIQWQDPGFHILRIVEHQPINPLGLALSHPLHHWMGRFAASLGCLEPSFAITLVSALASAIAVANIFGLVRLITAGFSSRWPAVFAAASLALANTYWQMATRAECYTVSAALLSAEWWCLIAYTLNHRSRYLASAFLLNGVGFSNHNLALLTLPILGVIILVELWRKNVKPTTLITSLTFWLVGASLYLGYVVADWQTSGNLVETVRSALFGHSFANRVLSVNFSAKLVALSIGFIGFNFPNLLLPLAAYGAGVAKKIHLPKLAQQALLAALAIHFVFVLRYNVPDQYMFFVPVYLFIVVFGGIGFAAILQQPQSRRRKCIIAAAVALLLTTPLTYVISTAAARRFDLLAAVVRDKPYRDDYVYVLIPWSLAENSAEYMSRKAMELAQPSGTIFVEDEMARYALEYQARKENNRKIYVAKAQPDVSAAQLPNANQPIVLVPASRNKPSINASAISWTRVGDLYVASLTP